MAGEFEGALDKIRETGGRTGPCVTYFVAHMISELLTTAGAELTAAQPHGEGKSHTPLPANDRTGATTPAPERRLEACNPSSVVRT